MNRKGMTIVELVVSFSLATIVALFLIQVILFLRDVYIVNMVKSEIVLKQSLISDRLNSLIMNKDIKSITDGCGKDCIAITFGDGSIQNISFDVNNNKIVIGDYVTPLSKDLKLKQVDFVLNGTENLSDGMDGLLGIDATLTSDLLKGEEFSINLLHQFNSGSNTEVVFEKQASGNVIKMQSYKENSIKKIVINGISRQNGLPTPSNPSKIVSLGTKNDTTGKYDIKIQVNHGNLITNGYGENKNNTNLSRWVYNETSESFPRNSFMIESSKNSTMRSDTPFLIDTSKDYNISMWAKSSDTTATYYVGIDCLDIDGKSIAADNIMYIENSLTYLTKDLNDGDTVVYLNNVSNFLNASTTPSYQLGFIFWNYQDSTGYTYPVETYSQNAWRDLYTYDGINKTNHTITLKQPWNKGTIKSGTKLSQSNSGGSYMYSLLSAKKLNLDWSYYSSTIRAGDFRPGTKYAKLLVLDNYYNTPNTKSFYSNFEITLADRKQITYSLEQPLRSLPDGTKDRLIIDNINKRAYVERNVGFKSFDGSETSWNLSSYSNDQYNIFYFGWGSNFGFNNQNLSSMTNLFQSKARTWDAYGSGFYTLQDALSNSSAYVWISLDKTQFPDLSTFKNYLVSQNSSGNTFELLYPLYETRIEELPYQEVQNYIGTTDIVVNDQMLTTIESDYIMAN